jgi:predicted 2-oxoglutarate/Fe(II)-dependent dioxygenase YbiX
LGAKQPNIFRIDCKTTQYFWIQSLIKKKENSQHRIFDLKNDRQRQKFTVHMKAAKISWPASTTIIYNSPVA